MCHSEEAFPSLSSPPFLCHKQAQMKEKVNLLWKPAILNKYAPFISDSCNSKTGVSGVFCLVIPRY